MKNLLIIDDDRGFVLKLMEKVAGKGVTVSFADDIKRASYMIDNNFYDYIIANAKIPGGSTLSLIDFFSKEKEKDKSIVYFMSNIDAINKSINETGKRCLYKYEIENRLDTLLN